MTFISRDTYKFMTDILQYTGSNADCVIEILDRMSPEDLRDIDIHKMVEDYPLPVQERLIEAYYAKLV